MKTTSKQNINRKRELHHNPRKYNNKINEKEQQNTELHKITQNIQTKLITTKEHTNTQQYTKIH